MNQKGLIYNFRSHTVYISVECGSHPEISFCTLTDLMICSSPRCEGILDSGHRV
jgi:hypothetical protein